MARMNIWLTVDYWNNWASLAFFLFKIHVDNKPQIRYIVVNSFQNKYFSIYNEILTMAVIL